jgi:syntaxin-binding protein 5
VSAVAYDPVQSLLAIGTNDTKFGEGQVYVFGQSRVTAVLNLQRRTSVRSLFFNADKLICFDARNDITIWSLESKRILCSYSPPGPVTAICCDPSIDYIFMGMQTGDVVAYDMDRGKPAPFRLPSFWREFDPRARVTPIVALALHPRDIGSLLIGYAEGAVVFSIKQNKPLKFFKYEVPRGAPGGDANPAGRNVVRHPRLTHAVWHPTGTFILTGHEDGSLVFWDASDGRIVMARTLTETNVNQQSSSAFNVAQTSGLNEVREPIYDIVWCANHDPEDTAILVCGGSSSTSPIKGLTLFEMGRTPVYATSSWEILSRYISSPKRQRMLPIPPGTDVIDICLLPRQTPHFAGAHDPIAMLALLGSGELITMSFPSGYPITPTNQLHVSSTFVHPFIVSINLSPIDRGKWLGMTEKRDQGPPLLKGGAEAIRSIKRYEKRNIVQTAHADGTIRLWDAGHGDEIENESVLEVDVGRAVGKHDGVEVTKMSLAGTSGELAVGTRSGEVVLFRWAHNRDAGRESSTVVDNVPRKIVDISTRTDPTLSDGLLPYTMLDMQNGPVTALKLSDVGFLAAGYEGGGVVVIDLRGPAIILDTHVSEFAKQEKRGFGRQTRPQGRNEHATFIEYSVMTVEGDGKYITTFGLGLTLQLTPVSCFMSAQT